MFALLSSTTISSVSPNGLSNLKQWPAPFSCSVAYESKYAPDDPSLVTRFTSSAVKPEYTICGAVYG
ncbi:MAG: hypothetical protein MJ195_02740 [Mycoplasmoidaceae bacterium]|nr:hypothetical protein [Mycoplasmoidaceae bacterium]